MKTLKPLWITLIFILLALYGASMQKIGISIEESTCETAEITAKVEVQSAYIRHPVMPDKSLIPRLPKTALNMDSLKTELWPGSASAVSFYASTLLLASVLNFSYDWISYGKKTHNGFTTGLTYSMDHVFGGKDLGVHFAYTLMTGHGNGHFEMKLGGMINMVHFEGDSFTFIPVISLGYRYQPPGQNSFFRIGLSTAGLGIGYGFVVASK